MAIHETNCSSTRLSPVERGCESRITSGRLMSPHFLGSSSVSQLILSSYA